MPVLVIVINIYLMMASGAAEWVLFGTFTITCKIKKIYKIFKNITFNRSSILFFLWNAKKQIIKFK